MAVARQLGLLFVLYVIQAVPLGLSAAVPLILQSRNVPYGDLAIYALASLPFSLKLLWAPIVDSTRLFRLGRRKSWLLPTQLLAGILMVAAGWNGHVGRWLGEDPMVPPSVRVLTFYFLVLYILMATQDIAVDGWALEILPVDMKKHASTCNTIGQNVGFYLSNISLLTMNDPETCNRFFRRIPQDYPMVSIGGFLRFWGFLMLGVTVYVALFEKERQGNSRRGTMSEDEIQVLTSIENGASTVITPSIIKVKDKETMTDIDISQSYKLLGKLVKLRPVQQACILLLTSRIAFAATDSAGTLKMVEAGIKKENIAMLAPLVFPWGILSSYLTGRLIGQFTALKIFRVGWCLRVCMVGVWIGVFLFTRDFYVPRTLDGPTAWTAVYWLGLYICVSLQQMFAEFMFVSQMAFFAQVSDTSIGGSSMTFFNTMANLGNKWPGMIALSVLERSALWGYDGFVVESVACIGIGLLWYRVLGLGTMRSLETAPASVWLLDQPKKKELELVSTSEGGNEGDRTATNKQQQLIRRSTASPELKNRGEEK